MSFAAPPLDWAELEALAAPSAGPSLLQEGPTSAQAELRLFGQPVEAVRVTLYRDHHAWCPYCQKVWLWLEEKRIPHRIRKVTMFCYGEKEAWYRRKVPSGMLPAMELDGRLITESDRILLALEAAFGPLGMPLEDPTVRALRQLERHLFGVWCQWLCAGPLNQRQEAAAEEQFARVAQRMEAALESGDGPFLLGDLSAADLVFVPYVERMSASLAYYKGYRLRRQHPAIARWFEGLECRSTYLGTQSDFHTHAHDLPPQMGGCFASGAPEQRRLAARIDGGPWPISEAGEPDPETSQIEPLQSAGIALSRVLRHREVLLARNPLGASSFALPLRCALTLLASGREVAPPTGTAEGLRYLRDRICVPRDMPLHAARRLRTALERTARLDPLDPLAAGQPIPRTHRRDQDPAPFLLARSRSAA